MFTERSDIVADDDPVRGYGVAVTPGREGPLVFVAGYGEPNRLYAPDGDRFVDTACGIVADGTRHGMGVCAADLDADGCEEVYVHNCTKGVDGGGDPDLLLNRLESERYRWTDLFALDVNADRLAVRAGRSVAALDRLGTGRYGVAVSGYAAPLSFYEIGDDGEITDMADAVGLEVNGGCRSLLAVPHCSGEGDLFAGVERGPNRLFRNDGGHYDSAESGTALSDPAGDTRGAALVDEDGRFAFAVGNEGGPNRLLRQTADGEFVDAAPPALRDTGRVRTVVAADFDNDGREELFFNASGEPNRLFSRADEATRGGAGGPDGSDADARWRRVDPGPAAEPDGFGTGAVAADIDGDGVLELIVVHGEVAAQPIAVYKDPTAAAAGWLRVRPTTRHGAPARGAVVRLETTDGVQRRTVDAGGGCLCQTEPVAHFGLGGATPVRVDVRWPDGRERALTDPAANAEFAVEHPSRTADPTGRRRGRGRAERSDGRPAGR
ncbi:CRTAC1 family protein [Halorubrum lipolyticum]|uniref:ASPIC/UnbV domain protein n=1 Tax=Halorubrum lipolyticum DSM 21995 TaxID=1227482 RepID=M0P1K3_9EURY|nr:CRTAC1 family protein [Halorubrum lipolyticum]EMA62685.1 ASPIC/UnbV domain protein [Halorubrum lipolyticum DSM 21995]